MTVQQKKVQDCQVDLQSLDDPVLFYLYLDKIILIKEKALKTVDFFTIYIEIS